MNMRDRTGSLNALVIKRALRTVPPVCCFRRMLPLHSNRSRSAKISVSLLEGTEAGVYGRW